MTSDLHHLSGAYAVDAVDDQERIAFEQHLDGCADCRHEVAELRATAALLAGTEEIAPPDRLRSQVLQGISSVRPLPPLDPSVQATPHSPQDPATGEPSPAGDSGTDELAQRRRARRPVLWLGAAAAAVAVLVAGLVIGPWRDQPDSVERISAAGDATTSAVTEQDTRISVVRSKELGQAALIVSGLDDPPAGKTYQAWLMAPDQSLHSAGLLPAPDRGHAVLMLEGATSAATALGITVEPAGGSPQPTSTPIVLMKLT